jgi:hypothetical protein
VLWLWSLWDTLRDCRSGYWLYFYYGRSYQHFIGRFIADRALPLFVGFSICAALSVTYLFKNRRETGQYN